MYSGPGAGTLLDAATAWDALAAELHIAAASYEKVVSVLISGSWQGPAAESMAAAAAPYVSWISTTATQATQAATQARAAASAYETALAATVPPPTIAANRSQLASLLASNIFGQNSSAIAATEAQYGQMWAQDAVAMFGYAGSSSAATKVTPFSAAPQTTNDSTASAAATTQSASSLGGIEDIFGIVPDLLKDLASLGTQYTKAWENMIGSMTGISWASSLWEQVNTFAGTVGKNAIWTNTVGGTINFGIGQFKTFYHLPAAAAIPKSSLGAGLGGARLAGSAGLAKAVSAGVGEASVVGRLSVPPGWATATPAIRLASTMLPGTSLAAAPMADLPANLLTPMSLGSLTGGAVGGSAPRVISGTRILGRTTAGQQNGEPVRLDEVIAQLTEQPNAVQHWHADPADLEKVLAELSLKPGIHTVHLSAGDKAAPAHQ
ncbi:PPE family protein [Mycobacterium sp. pUA109]|uniref:PPE family protein n=1 Tax=Mycobacterium sp. pUA109 TaxID=3238982 RepID=UPI00351AD309